MKNIKSLSFEFTKKLYQKNPQQSTYYSIHTTWDKEQNNIPAIVKIRLEKKEDEDLSFDFCSNYGRSYRRRFFTAIL